MNGKIRDYDFFYRRYIKLLEKAGLMKGQCNLYRFRHTFITDVSKKFPLVLASRMAGHNSVTMTEKYVMTTQNEIIEASAQYVNKH